MKKDILHTDYNCLLRHLVQRSSVAPAEGKHASTKLNIKTKTNKVHILAHCYNNLTIWFCQTFAKILQC